MPDPATATAENQQPAIPEGAGLAPGRARGDDPPKRSSRELVDAAAGGQGLSAREHDDLVGYYLENGAMPGDDEPVPYSVELGHGSSKRTFHCELHSIEWDEWQDARERATDEKTGVFDSYVASSYNVARALVKPKLGPIVARQHQEAQASDDGKIAGPRGERVEPVSDAAHLLRRMFRKQPGALLELSGKVLELSRLQSDSSSVKEVEAAKN